MLAIAAAVQLVRASQNLNSAQKAIRTAESEVQSGRIAAAAGRLAAAERDLVKGSAIVNNDAALSVVGLVPVFHQNLAAIKRSTSLALEMTNGGRRLLETATSLEGPNGRVEVPLRQGAIPLDLVSSIRDQLDQLSLELPGKGEAPSGAFLIGKVRTLQRQLYDDAAVRRKQFSTVARGLDVLADMAGANGPRRYLIAVANAAEMRGTGGMILSYAVLTSDNGAFKLERQGPIDDLKLSGPAIVNPTPGYVTRFSQLDPTQLWRNATVGADFTKAAPVLESMFTASTGEPVDGVIQIDSMGLAALLDGIGPVNVPDVGLVSADNAVALTINEAYTKFPDKPVRKEYLQSVAEVAFQRLLSGNYPSLRALGASLARAADQRNIIVYADRPETQRSLEGLHATGAITDEGDYLQLTAQNFTGNKLDYYMDSSVRVTGTRSKGQKGQWHTEVRLTNTAPPDGRPPYVFRPLLPALVNGEYHSVVTLYVPPGTAIIRSSGLDQPQSLALGAEDDRSVVSFTTNVAPGETRVVTFDLELPPRPPGAYTLKLDPTPRVRPTLYDLDITGTGRRLRFDAPVLQPTSVH